jgi:hypothetical protein
MPLLTAFQWLIRFQHMDRRWIFVGMAVAIGLPMWFPIPPLPFSVDRPVQEAYDAVEALPAGATVFISADFDPGSRPELEPYYRAVLHQLFRNDIKIVSATLWPSAVPLVFPILNDVAAEYDKEYGTDYCFLGFKDGKELAIKSMGENIPKTFPVDVRGNPIGSLPVTRGFTQLKDFPLLILVSAGFPGIKEYVLQVQGQYGLTMVGATTAVSGPDYIPYYKAGQLVGLSSGMPGSAQYEKLTFILSDDVPVLPEKLLGIEGVNVLNLGHLFIVLLIVLGNLAYFATRKEEVE